MGGDSSIYRMQPAEAPYFMAQLNSKQNKIFYRESAKSIPNK
jgi:hypothetical protein